MPIPTKEELELLTFLSDANGQVRQVAVEHVASFSTKGHPSRQLLTQSPRLLRAVDGIGSAGANCRLMGRGGKECDPIEDLKALCKDQPVSSGKTPLKARLLTKKQYRSPHTMPSPP